MCTGKQVVPITEMSQDEPLSSALISYWGWIVLGRDMTLSEVAL